MTSGDLNETILTLLQLKCRDMCNISMRSQHFQALLALLLLRVRGVAGQSFTRKMQGNPGVKHDGLVLEFEHPRSEQLLLMFAARHERAPLGHRYPVVLGPQQALNDPQSWTLLGSLAQQTGVIKHLLLQPQQILLGICFGEKG